VNNIGKTIHLAPRVGLLGCLPATCVNRRARVEIMVFALCAAFTFMTESREAAAAGFGANSVLFTH
jgi:hypothetical protein